jgi:pilus assembly protein CpaB
MKARGMVVVVAFVLATVATIAVFMYINGVRKQAETSGKQVEVIVSTVDIPAGTRLDDMISGGSFATSTFPEGDLVRGVVTTLDELHGRVTSTPILAGEQISTARLQGSTTLPGGSLGIPDGFEGVTIPLDTSRAAGGEVRRGDHVTVFGTFQDVGGTNGTGDVTVALVPDVRVLKTSKASTEDTTQGGMMIMLALRPRDAQKVVFAQENGFVWLGLLPPGQNGKPQPPLTAGQVTR